MIDLRCAAPLLGYYALPRIPFCDIPDINQSIKYDQKSGGRFSNGQNMREERSYREWPEKKGIREDVDAGNFLSCNTGGSSRVEGKIV